MSLLWPMIRLSHNSMVDKHNFQEYTLHFCNDIKVVAARGKSEPARHKRKQKKTLIKPN